QRRAAAGIDDDALVAGQGPEDAHALLQGDRGAVEGPRLDARGAGIAGTRGRGDEQRHHGADAEWDKTHDGELQLTADHCRQSSRGAAAALAIYQPSLTIAAPARD